MLNCLQLFYLSFDWDYNVSVLVSHPFCHTDFILKGVFLYCNYTGISFFFFCTHVVCSVWSGNVLGTHSTIARKCLRSWTPPWFHGFFFFHIFFHICIQWPIYSCYISEKLIYRKNIKSKADWNEWPQMISKCSQKSLRKIRLKLL